MQQQIQQQTVACLRCGGTGHNRRGGPCANCGGRGVKILSTNPAVHMLQLVGRIVGSTFMAIQALAMLTLALAVIAVIVVVTLIFMGVHI